MQRAHQEAVAGPPLADQPFGASIRFLDPGDHGLDQARALQPSHHDCRGAVQAGRQQQQITGLLVQIGVLKAKPA